MDTPAYYDYITINNTLRCEQFMIGYKLNIIEVQVVTTFNKKQANRLLRSR